MEATSTTLDEISEEAFLLARSVVQEPSLRPALRVRVRSARLKLAELKRHALAEELSHLFSETLLDLRYAARATETVSLRLGRHLARLGKPAMSKEEEHAASVEMQRVLERALGEPH